MSGGSKKKSGFQITSVTSDYEQQQQQQQREEGRASPPTPGGGDASPKGPGGGGGSPRVPRGGPAPGEEGDPGGGGGGEEEGGGGQRANGGGSVASAAGAPVNGPSGPPVCSGGGGGGGVSAASVSRFRVVKLDQGSGEPYKRGRWTCRDFYEPEAEPLLAAWAASAGRLAAAAAAASSTASDRDRQPHSLDSRLEAAAGLHLAKPPQGPFSPQPQRRGPPAAAAAPAHPHPHQHHHLLLPGGPGAPGYYQARSLGGGGLPGLLRPPAAPPSPGTLRSPLAAAPDALRPPGAPQEPPAGDTPGPPPGLIPTLVVEEPRLPNKSVAQLIRGEADEPRRKVSSPRQSRSRPSSPAPPLFRDASPSRRTSDPLGAARFSLAQSMFGMGVAPHDSDDDR